MENPLTCDCNGESINFVSWIQKTNVLRGFNNVTCESVRGVQSLHEVSGRNLWIQCSHISIISISVASTIVCFSLLIVVVITYRWRFRIRYKIFKTGAFINKFCRFQRNSDSSADHYEYDAFVSYSSDDRFWVHDVLMKTLEDIYGFKLVIHYRDFLLGQNIQHNITTHMKESRDFILVLTENFFESDWCQMELEAAYQESLRRHRNIIIIVLGDVPQNIDNPTATYLLDTHTYLQWAVNAENENQNADKHKLFWEKLVHCLYGGKQCCCCPFGPRAIGYREVS